MAPIFRALGDPGRRVLLDRLFERDGQTLGELCEHCPEMTRFGVMKHLGGPRGRRARDDATVGREKRHFLNPVPIRLVHDRWIGKFAEPVVGAMTALKHHLEARWTRRPRLRDRDQGLARPGLARDHRWRRHGPLLLRHARRVRLDAGSPLVYTYADGSVAADGSVIEIDAGRRIVMVPAALGSPRIDPRARSG